MTLPRDDSDWLDPEPVELAPLSTSDLVCVYRLDAEGEDSILCSSLTDALREPPLTPEARIIAHDGDRRMLLAEATRDDERCAWVLTSGGRALVAVEIKGAA